MDTRNKKILLISFRCPWPFYKGGYALRISNIAKILSKRYTVDLLTVVENKEDEASLADLRRIVNRVFYFHHPRIKEYAGFLRAFFSPKPLQVGYFYSRKMASWVRSRHSRYDAVFCSTIRSAEYVKGLDVTKCIDFIDALSLSCGAAAKYSNLFWRTVYNSESKRLLNYERGILNTFDISFITAQKDKDYILNGTNNKMLVLPNGVNSKLFQRKFSGEQENRAAFLGKMDYRPNEDACVFFVREIFPRIKKEIPEFGFDIVGTNTTKKVLNLQKVEGVRVIGRIDDPYYYLERAKIIVAPIRFGGGIQNKILEAMALGKLVITTPVGAGGIPDAENKKHLIVVGHQHPDEMAETIRRFLNDEKARSEIGKEARQLILKSYTWDGAEEILLGNLSSIMRV